MRIDKIRQIILFAIILAFVGAVRNTAFADYPIVAYRFMADPAVFVHDGRVYLYCSNDNENALDGGYVMKSLVCVSSGDMKNWTDHGVVFSVPANASWAKFAWAPSVIERDGKIFLYFGNGGSGIGVASSNSPTGPFVEPLGHELINWSTPGAGGPNMWLFDPAAFIDDDGQAYLYFGGNGESNVRAIKLNRDMISVSGAAQTITAPAFFEASWMHHYNGVYYFSYSTNPSHGMRIDYMTSNNPLNGFTYGGVVASQPPDNDNNNHAGIFAFKDNWYFVYHNREVATKAGIPTTYKRNLGIEQLFYKDDNSIEQIKFTRDGVTQLESLNPLVRVEAETMAEQSGIKTEVCSAGGMDVTEISNGDWIRVREVDFGTGVFAFDARVASTTHGTIQLHLDSSTGPLIGSCKVTATGGLQVWATANATVDDHLAQGVHDLYFVFADVAQDNCMSMDWWQFKKNDTLTYSEWISDAFPGEMNQLVIGPRADPDGDTYSNLMEYFMGTQPEKADSKDMITNSVDTANNMIMIFPMSNRATGVSYDILQSRELSQWEELQVTAHSIKQIGSQSLMQVTVPLAGNQPCFLTLTVSKVLDN